MTNRNLPVMNADSSKRFEEVLPARLAPTQGGWAMMETLIALILVLLLSIAAYYYFQMSRNNANISEVRQSLMISKSNVERLFSGQPSYTGLNNALAVRAKIVPSSMVMGDMDSTDITHKLGGDVTFSSDTAGTYGAANSHYTITAKDIPQEACIEFATYSRTDWVDVLVEGTSIDENDVASASTACSGLDKNEMVFVSR